jgi:hypothetical protein
MESALEHKLLNSYKSEMISFLNAHPEYFEEAVELLFQINSRILGVQLMCCGV